MDLPIQKKVRAGVGSGTIHGSVNSICLRLLKAGALVKLYFLANTFTLSADAKDAQSVIPAQILFAVSAYRSLGPSTTNPALCSSIETTCGIAEPRSCPGRCA